MKFIKIRNTYFAEDAITLVHIKENIEGIQTIVVRLKNGDNCELGDIESFELAKEILLQSFGAFL